MSVWPSRYPDSELDLHNIMKNLITPGRLLFAVAMIAFGIQHLIFAVTGAGLGPPWTPEYHLLAYFIGAGLIAASVGLAAGWQVRCAAIVVALIALVRVVICYAHRLAATPRDPGPWTSSFELLAMGGAGLVLAATFANRGTRSGRGGALLESGRFLFAISLLVFGIQHLMYGAFVATLIPKWIPGHLFWAYFVGVAFIAAALAIVSGKLAPLAATLLGIMFLLWVVTLHAPRVVAALHNPNEWTSMFVALAMSGGAWIVAGALAGRD
jgi:uncharacterized membrane protein YphA (DoxX/SURF4 family)